MITGVCLSVIGDKTSVYDKFTALRDMSRGLWAAALLRTAGVPFAFALNQLNFGQFTFLINAFACATAGFAATYRRYASLAEEAVYAQVVATKLPAPNAPAPQTSTTPAPQPSPDHGQRPA